MNTKSMRPVLILALLVALALALTSCGVKTYRTKLPPEGQKELTLGVTGVNWDTVVTVETSEGPLAFEESDIKWVYDVAAGEQEYLIVEYNSEQVWYVYVHRWENKIPGPPP